ncbi:MAG: phage protein Gp36 family protein [Pseudomonadota bacterium]
MTRYATPADLARVATDSWDELAQRATRSTLVDGELLRRTYYGEDRSAYGSEAITLADAAMAVLTDALERASRHADAYLAPRYQAVMPLSAELIAGSDLPSAVATLALRRLYGHAVPDDVRNGTRWADEYLRDLSTGKASLGQADTATAAVPGRMHISAPGKAFDWGAY